MNTKSKIPRYRQLYETLKKHIISGIYKEGDFLPSENELCAIHNLTRPTVRQALNELLQEGYIIRRQGKGSIVHKQAQEIGILSIQGVTSAIGSRGLATKILVKPVIKKFPAVFMFELSETEKESGCIYMERLRLVEDIPVFYDTNYLPNINLPRFTARGFENKSLFETLRAHYGIEVKGGIQRLRAIRANKKLGKHFRVKPGCPFLHPERKIETNREGYAFYSSVYCNTEGYSLVGRF